MAVTQLPRPATGSTPSPPDLTEILAAQRQAFLAHGAPSAERRRADLNTLARLVLRNRKPIVDALRKDFGARSEHETEMAEIATSVQAIRYHRRHLARWMQPRRRSTGIWFIPAGNRIVPQPKGVVGIMTTWNFPVNLCVSGLAAALAAGNRVMVKTSELAPASADLLARLMAEHFPADQVSVVVGGVDVSQAFAALPLDHLLFTGSTAVGRQVMRAAAENLTPVTLELGGKSPVIIDEGYPLRRAAERVVWGKLLNSGQICIAPDYVLVPAGREREFAALATDAARTLYPKVAGNPDYTAIVNDTHYQRLCSYIEEAKAKGASVESALSPADCRGERKLPLTVVVDPTDDLRLSSEEIFGPILPVRGYGSLDEAIGYVNGRARPLALYLFSDSPQTQERVLAGTTSGGVSVNDVLLQYLQDDLPFGGVGPSGMGSYHGREGFDTFSHLKPVFSQRGLGSRTGAQLLYPPCGRLARLLLGLMRRI